MTLKIMALCFVCLTLLSAAALRAAAPVPVEPASGNPLVVVETSLGSIKIELFQDKAPISVKNFLAYTEDKHYDGTIFHRVIEKFMIQGGGMDKDMKQKKTKDPIKNESANGLSNLRGTVAMARTNVVDSATSQFFVNTVDNKFLDRAEARDGAGYCVFGRVIDGMDVVDKIKVVKVTSDVPNETVEIKSVKVEKKK